MLIGLSSLTYDLSGALIVKALNHSDVPNVFRRVARTATLDGGAVLYDNGFSHGDRTVVVQSIANSEAERASLKYFVETYGSIYVSTYDGVFLGAPESYNEDFQGIGTLTLLLISKASN